MATPSSSLVKIPQPQFAIAPAANRKLGGAGMGTSSSAPELKSKVELKSQIVSLVKSAVNDRKGPSFEERLDLAVAQKNVVMKESERHQWNTIRECKERGEMKSAKASPFANIGNPDRAARAERAKMLEKRKYAMNEQVKGYMKQRKAMMEKIRTREPLFKLSDVKGAQDQLAAQAAKRREDMRMEEKKRWEMLEEINRSVLQRPLLMDT
jgi:hypothetical protein